MELRFSPEYKDAVFYAWYKAGRPRLTKVVNFIPPTPDGRKPNTVTVKDWVESENWYQRADALDAEVSMKIDQEVIEARVTQLREMAQLGKEVMNLGYEYLKDEGFDSAASAVRAVGLGGDMYFKYAAAADYIAKIGTMSDKQLDRELMKLLNKGDGEILEGDAEDVNEPEDDLAGE